MNDRAAHIRRIRGLRTQQEFANLMEVRRATVSAWEAGGEVSLRHARRLVALGVPVELFLGDTQAQQTEDVA